MDQEKQQYILPVNYSGTKENILCIYHWEKINNVATIDLVIGHNKFDPFCQKSERYYDESMDNPVVAKFATIGDDDNYIDKQTSKQTQLKRIWSSLVVLPRKPSTAETTINDPNNPLPKPTDFELDGGTTKNASNSVIIEEGGDKQPTTKYYELLVYNQ